jgi:soluble lytic murein transglycosylase-like protein
MIKILVSILVIFLILTTTELAPAMISLDMQRKNKQMSRLCSLKWIDSVDILYSDALTKAIALDDIIHQGKVFLSEATLENICILKLHSLDKNAAKKRIERSKNPIHTIKPIIQEASKKHKTEPEMIQAIITAESEGKNKALSSEGARGLMQIMPETGRKLGIKDLSDPVENINGGTRYWKFLLDYFKGNKQLALAAYNAGPKVVIESGNRVPLKTQSYVNKVMGHYWRIKKEYANS